MKAHRLTARAETARVRTSPPRTARNRLPRRGDDRGSLVMAMLVTVIAVGIGALLLPVVLNQIHTTSWGNSRGQEVGAAEAGVEAALGLVRSATDATGAGVVTSLPCTNQAPLTGPVDGAGQGLTYSATIRYYTQDPLGKSAAWLATYTSSNGGMGMLCAAGSGTYFPPTKEQVPSYVVITSTGMDSRGSRTLQGTYVVQTSNANIAGGTIYIFPSGSATYCMDAGSSRPVAGATVRLQACAKPVSQQQGWAYNSDLSIVLVSSITSTYPNGLCLTSPSALGGAIALQQCSVVGSSPYTQLWSVDNNAHLEGAKADRSNVSGNCINVASQGGGIGLTLKACAGGVTDTDQTWVPSPDVGAGMAGAGNRQLVNFQQFGRCMDVTNQNVGWTFLIAFTCKQNPNPGWVLWNQKFTMNSSGELVTNNGSDYCLTSPLKSYVSGPSGPYVTLVKCPTAPTAAVRWTQYGATDTQGNSLPPLKKYTIEDNAGECLSLTSGTADAYNGQYNKVIVATCDGTTLQKWDASPDVRVPALTNLREVAAGS